MATKSFAIVHFRTCDKGFARFTFQTKTMLHTLHEKGILINESCDC